MYSFFLYTVIFLYGSIIGSFLNVCIYRIPAKEDIVAKRSSCQNCGNKLQWFDMFPVFSWIFLRGKCRYCGKKISVQYPVIEALNGILWVITFLLCGFTWMTIIYCLMISALIVLSVIDWRTFEIPFGLNVFIFVLGVIATLIDREEWTSHLLGFFFVSGVFYLVYIITKKKGIGGGDIKLMAAAGILIGWQMIFVAMLFGCLYGSVIHILRMRISKADHVLALGPYLAAGILTAVWFGEEIMNWYLSIFLF